MMSSLRTTLGVLLALLAIAPNAFAEWMLRPHLVTTGGPLEVEVLRANDTNHPINDPLPARLPARLRHGDASVDVTLERAEVIDAGMLAPGAFRKATYRVSLPADVHGAVEITLAGAPRSSALFIAPVPTPPTTASGAKSLGVASPATEAPTAPIDRTLTAAEGALSTHEPMYIVVGTRESTSAKFQLSMKYRLLDGDTWIGQRFMPLSKIYLGFTQTPIWDIGTESAPFRDTSYRPSVFYYEPNAWRAADGTMSTSFSTGLEHESNGKNNTASRSINIAFARPRLRIGLGGGRRLVAHSPAHVRQRERVFVRAVFQRVWRELARLQRQANESDPHRIRHCAVGSRSSPIFRKHRHAPQQDQADVEGRQDRHARLAVDCGHVFR